MCRSFALFVLVFAAFPALTQDFALIALIDTNQPTNELSGDVSSAGGFGGLFYDEPTDTLSWEFTYAGLTGAVTAAHIHGPADPGTGAGVLIDLNGPSGGLDSPIVGSMVVDDAQIVADLRQGRTYVNLHTATNPAGEIRGQIEPATSMKLPTGLDPSQQTQPPNGDISAAIGSGGFTYDLTTDTLSWSLAFGGLTGDVVAAHLHGPAQSGEGAGVLIDLEPNSGALTSPMEGSVVVDDMLVVAYLAGGATYANLHTGANPAGEIRGQVKPARNFVMEADIEPGQAVSALNGDVSAALGTGSVTYDADQDQFFWRVAYGGLTGAVTVAHIHGPARPGVNAGVLIGIDAGGVESPIEGMINDPSAANLGHIISNQGYFNIHTQLNPGGEIRGQILPILFQSGFEISEVTQ